MRRADTFEQFRNIAAIGDWHDTEIPVPSSGVWGLRIYTRLRDSRGGDSEAFPSTHYWAAAGPPAYERLVYADGHTTETGEGDTAGELFQVRGTEGPSSYPLDYDVAYPFRGNWDG